MLKVADLADDFYKTATSPYNRKCRFCDFFFGAFDTLLKELGSQYYYTTPSPIRSCQIDSFPFSFWFISFNNETDCNRHIFSISTRILKKRI
jgi:hypothetical protein